MRYAQPKRWFGIYWPTLRQPYGRRPYSCPFVEDAQRIKAAWVRPWQAQTKDIPMPQGGTRTLAQCPVCLRWVAYLYPYDRGKYCHCRTCAGLVYRSQYEGRRPEADWKRIEALFQRAITTSGKRGERLHLNACNAADLSNRRVDRYVAWRSIAVPLSFLTLYAREADRAVREGEREAKKGERETQRAADREAQRAAEQAARNARQEVEQIRPALIEAQIIIQQYQHWRPMQVGQNAA